MRGLARAGEIILLVILVGLIGVPLVALGVRAGSLDGATFVAPETLAVVRLTAGQALASLVGAFALGVPLGWAMAPRFSPGLAQTVGAFFAMPTLLTALAFARLLAGTPVGYSLAGVVLAHAFLNAPWIAIMVAERRHGFPREIREAARMLGAGPARTFLDHELPFLRPVLFQAGAQVFVVCAMSFVIVLLLGGGPPVGTLETEIYARVRLGDLDLAQAIAYALWQIILCAPPALWALHESRRARGWTRVGAVAAGRGNPALVMAFALVLFAPYLPMLARGVGEALKSGGFAPEIWPALATSLGLSFAATGLVTACAFFAALRSTESRLGALVAAVAQVPSGVSTLVLCLGFWLAYARFVDPFEGSPAAIVALQVATVLPWAVRRLLPLASLRNDHALAAARTLGASPAQAWLVAEWPRWRGPLVSVAALAFCLGLGEIAAVSFFASENLVPLSLLLSRWGGQYRFAEAAQGFAVLFGLCLVGSALAACAATSRNAKTSAT